MNRGKVSNSRWIVALIFLGFAFTTQAGLIDRGNGMIYDDVLNVTWLQDANYMKTSGASDSGYANWDSAQSWVNSLDFGGYTDWRLPTISPISGNTYNTSFTFNGTSDRGFNNDSINSELGYMFYQNLNNVSYYNNAGVGPQAGSESLNSAFVDAVTGETVEFENIGFSYWASPANNPFANAAWAFNFQTTSGIATGEQQLHGLFAGLNVWAVRDGDVPQAPIDNNVQDVPEPPALFLLGLGLLLLARRPLLS